MVKQLAIVIAFAAMIASGAIVHAQEKTHAELGPVGQQLADACAVLNGEQYDLLVTYAARIEKPVAIAGCGAIGVYGALMGKTDAGSQVLADFEDDTKLMTVASRLVSASPRFAEMLSARPQDGEAIVVTLVDIPASGNMLDELASTIERDWPRDIAPSDGPLVLSLALLLTPGSDNPTGISRTLNDIRQMVASPDLPLLAMLMQISGMERVDVLARKRLTDAKDAVSTLSRRAPGAIDLFRRMPASLNFAPMFLPPPPELFRHAQELSDEEMRRLRHEYVETMAGAFAALAPNAGAVRAMIALDALQGPIMDAIARYHNGDEILTFLQDFSKSNLFASIVASACGEEWQVRVRTLAWTFAPSANCITDMENDRATGERKGVVTCPTRPGWEGHLGRVARWYADVTWAARLLTTTDSTAGLRVLQTLPRVMEPLDHRTVARVGAVVAGLGKDLVLAGQLIADLGDTTDYLRWLAVAKDAEEVVIHDPEVLSGRIAPKAIYVLITSYPSRQDHSLVEDYVMSKTIDSAQVTYLTAATASDLNRHLFTATDRFQHYLDETLDVLGDYLIVTKAPITGGGSIGIVAAKKSGLIALKWAARTAAKRSITTLKKLFAERGAKVAIREWRNALETEMLGPGRPPTGSREIRRWVDRINNGANNVRLLEFLLGFLVANRLGEDNDIDTCKP